jgi:hypothetical protein
MPNITELVRLQEADLALDSRRATLAAAESRIGETDELLQLRERVAMLRDALHAAEGTQKDVELEADALKAKIAPAEEKLYSGAVKNPKELTDLQADVDQLKRQLSSVEDRDLEALTSLESAQSESRTAEAELAALEQSWAAEQAELTATIARLGTEIGELEGTRRERVEYIDNDLLARYDHVRRAHQGRGVAKLDRNLCLGCRISLPVSMVNKARSGGAVVQCPNCERILYA